MGECCPVNVRWVFMINPIFSHMLVPFHLMAVGVIGRVHRSVVGSLIPFKITLVIIFHFTFCVGKSNLTSRFA
jgi:hypothetical protein